MARVDATHAIRHPFQSKKVLLLRQTTNPTDPAGAFGVMKIVTRRGYEEHYAKQCEWLDSKPIKLFKNRQGEPDAVILTDEVLSEAVLQARAEMKSLIPGHSVTAPTSEAIDPELFDLPSIEEIREQSSQRRSNPVPLATDKNRSDGEGRPVPDFSHFQQALRVRESQGIAGSPPYEPSDQKAIINRFLGRSRKV